MKIYLVKIADHKHIILNGFTNKEDAEKYVKIMEEQGTKCFIEENVIGNIEITW